MMRTQHTLTKTQGFILSIFLISLFMTAVMTLGMLAFTNGLSHIAFKIFWKNFIQGCIVAIPAGYVIVPLVQKLIDSISDK